MYTRGLPRTQGPLTAEVGQGKLISPCFVHNLKCTDCLSGAFSLLYLGLWLTRQGRNGTTAQVYGPSAWVWHPMSISVFSGAVRCTGHRINCPVLLAVLPSPGLPHSPVRMLLKHQLINPELPSHTCSFLPSNEPTLRLQAAQC